MYISKRIKSVQPAPVDELNERVRKLNQREKRVINLGQAIPSFTPSPISLEKARRELDEHDTHTYCPDAGILPLREALSEHQSLHYGVEVDPRAEIIITAGANQAFMLAAISILEPGDEVILPSPYFVNHEMAVRLAGGVPVEAPLSNETGFQLRLEDIQPFINSNTRALVIVTPNNPTGAVYRKEALREIGQYLTARNIMIVVDETYHHFTYDGAEHVSLQSFPEIRDNTITIGSFSKSHGMSGWRVGYFLAHPAIVHEATKAQDAMVICAPVMSQKLALIVSRESTDELAARREAFRRRRDYLEQWAREIPALDWRGASGAYFAFVEVEGCADSDRLALEILNDTHVVLIPGVMFGKYGEGFLRFSYGSVEPPELEEACARLSEYFSTSSSARTMTGSF